MNSFERRSVFSLAGIYGLRMLGLFMILPVFSLYAEGLEGVTPMLIGLALGVYGLTMAIFQIPFGMLSDRFGRKPIITLGLLLFAIGSVIAAMSDSIWGVIIGRAIQGSGAIAAAMMALMADLTKEEERTKAMAIMGVSIGMSFTLALMIGPLLNAGIGVDGIFWMTAVLAAAGIAILYLLVPDPLHLNFHREVETVPAQLKQIFFDAQLFRLDVGILIQHGIMMAMFSALPFVLRDKLGLPTDEHAWFYLPVLMLSVLGMAPLVMIAEKKQKMKQVFIGSILLMMVSEVMLGTDQRSLIAVGIGLLLFFIAFNVLEASLPSLISRMAPVESKGTAMGVYSTSQFLGAFVGGAGGGWLSGEFGIQAVFYACAIAALGWLLLSLGMKVPAYLSSFMMQVNVADEAEADQLAEKIKQLDGVHEAKVILEDGVAYLKVDKKKFDQQQLMALVGGGSN
ncbi:putative arabinose efflux permease, MFS family [Mariprofundus aestuarium]|uniref:Putative arabinose efflux permease, MFS family n=1 Tax=Mariprofundus aestuarium TaxID=1921086 RepID=A0A2K8L740_MARES|nr:MFS transporter [Mariprofundus aestuarium]ATX80086.1 putative arabinose efflux permease, MFS family [Mariprofundus aestuarium]